MPEGQSLCDKTTMRRLRKLLEHSLPTSPRRHPAAGLHFGGGGSLIPILIRAYRMPLAEVIVPSRHSASGSIFSSFGAADFAAGPRLPSAIATQYRTESSGESSSDVMSATAASVISLSRTLCVRFAKFSAASVLAFTDFADRTFATDISIWFTSFDAPFAMPVPVTVGRHRQTTRMNNLGKRIFTSPFPALFMDAPTIDLLEQWRCL